MEIFDRFINIISDSNEPIVFEFGANNGRDTNTMYNLLKNTNKNFKYYVFEPDPRIFPVLIQSNKSHINEIILVPAAIGNIDGDVTFYLSGGSDGKKIYTGSSSIKEPKKVLRHYPHMTFEKTSVRCHKFDTYYYKNITPKIIDFIWADIQGAERDMIDGGQEALSKTRYLYTEYYDIELYDGQIGANDIIKNLPGKWSLIENYGGDILLKNEKL